MLTNSMFRRGSTSAKARSKFFRPRLEVLEARLVLAGVTYYWTGAGISFNASEMANWTTGNPAEPPSLPGHGDIAVLDGVARGGGNPNSNLLFDAAFTADLAELRITPGYAGAVSVFTNLLIGSVDHQRGNLTIASGETLIVNNFIERGGSLRGVGTLSITGTESAPGLLDFRTANTHLLRNISLDIESSLLIGAATTFNSTIITSAGTTEWRVGQITLSNTAQFINNGILNATQTAMKIQGGATERFTNNGLFNKDSQTLEIELAVPFTQGVNGEVDVRNGTLKMSQAGTYGGRLDIWAGTTVEMAGGIHQFQPGISVIGLGTILVSDGSLRLDPALNLHLYQPLRLSGIGQIQGTGQAGSLTTHSTFHWTAGTITELALFRTEGTTTLLGGAAPLALTKTRFEQAGQATWQAGNINLLDAVFANFAHFDLTGAGVMEDQPVGGSSFENLVVAGSRGQVRKVGGATTEFNVTFRTYGDLLLNGHHLKFTRGLQQSGSTSWTDIAGGLLDAGPEYQLQGGTLTGGGTIAGSLLVGAGVVSVGATESLTIVGNYTQQQAGTLQVKASGNDQWGDLLVWGDTNLAGTFDFVPLGGYNPPSGFTHDFLTALGALTSTLVSSNPNWTTSVFGGNLRATRV